MSDRPVEGIEPAPQRAFSRKSDANAFKLPAEEIHRQLLANINSGPVPDKDSVSEVIRTAESYTDDKRIQIEMEGLESDLLSGDPVIRERARRSLDGLSRFTHSLTQATTQTEDFKTGTPEIYPPEGTPERSRLNSAFSKLMRILGRRDDPSAEALANRQWNDLRDPGTRDKTIKEVLGDE